MLPKDLTIQNPVSGMKNKLKGGNQMNKHTETFAFDTYEPSENDELVAWVKEGAEVLSDDGTFVTIRLNVEDTTEGKILSA